MTASSYPNCCIRLTGVEINAQNECYGCGYVEGLTGDFCTPDNFDPNNQLNVQKLPCENGGKCFVSNNEHFFQV